MKANLNAETKIVGVAGNPVQHSLSPIFQNYIIRKNKLNWVYLPFCVDVENFGSFIVGIKALDNIVGLNITVPFKEAVLPHCDELSDEAAQIKAVNTLLFKQGKIIGYNTDVSGILATLKDKLAISSLKGKNVVLIGAGGAAKAALYALYKLNSENVYIINRSLERAAILKRQFETNFKIVNVESFKDLDRLLLDVKPYLVINSTTIGLKGEKLPIDFRKLWKKTKIFDMVYNVAGTTPLVKEAHKSGLKGVDGLYMLVFQGAKSFSLWSGVQDFIVTDVFNYLKKKIKNG